MNNNLVNNYTNNSLEETQNNSQHNVTSQQIKPTDISFGSFIPQSDHRFHNDIAKLISEESSFLDLEEDENIKKRRIFEMNLNKKRNCIRKEFHKQEDFRQSNQKTSLQTSNENKFKEILNEWIQKNDEKSKYLERDKEVFNKISSKDLTLNMSQSSNNMKFKKIQNTSISLKPKNEFTSVFPIASNISLGQDYFPLKNERNPEELNNRLEVLKAESEQTQIAQDGETQRYKSLIKNYDNLVQHLDQRKKEIREEETLILEMTKKHNNFQQNQIEILKNLFSTRRNVQQLQEAIENIEDKSGNIIQKKLVTQTQEQKEIKQEENKLSSILLKIDQAQELHKQSIYELIEVQKEEEYRKHKKNESFQLISSLKDMKYLDDLCLKNKIDEYIDSKQLEFYTTKNQHAINFDDFEIEYPLINFRRSLPNIESSKLQDVIDDFYKEYPSGPYKLSESLLEKYKGYNQKFESLKRYQIFNFYQIDIHTFFYRYYQDMCLQVQEKVGELALLTTNLNEYVEEENKSKLFDIKDKQVIQLLEGFEDLKGSIETFKDNKKLTKDFKKQVYFALELFMKILDNTLRLTNIVTLISTGIYPELLVSLTSKSDEVQTIIKEKFNKKNIKILRKYKTKYSTKLENFEVNNARLSRLSIISPDRVQQLSRQNSQSKLKKQDNHQDQSYEFKSYYNDNQTIKIVPNDFDNLFIQLINNDFIPIQLKEKWGKQIVQDPLIYGFCNRTDIQEQINQIVSQQQSPDQQQNLDTYDILLQKIINKLRIVSMDELSSILKQILELKGQILRDIRFSQNQCKFFISLIIQQLIDNKSYNLLQIIVIDKIKSKSIEWDYTKFKLKKISTVSQHKLIKEVQIKVSNKIETTLVNPVDSPQAKIRIVEENIGDNKKNNNQFKVEDFIEYLKKDKNQSKKQLQEVDQKFKNEDIIKRRKSSALFKENYEKYYILKESDHYDQITSQIKKKYEEIEEQNEEEKYREEMRVYLIEKEKKELAKQKSTNHYQESNKSNRYGTYIKDLLENSHAMAFISRQELTRKKQDLSRTQIQLKKQEYLLETKYDNNSKSRANTQMDRSESRGDITINKEESHPKNQHSKSFSQDVRKVNIREKKQAGKSDENTQNEQNQTTFPRLQANSQQKSQNTFGDENNSTNINERIKKVENAYKRVNRARSTNTLPQSQQNLQSDRNKNENQEKQLQKLMSMKSNGDSTNKMNKITQSYVNIRSSKLNIPALKLAELINEKKQQQNNNHSSSINQIPVSQTQKQNEQDEEKKVNENDLNKTKQNKNNQEEKQFYRHLSEIKEVSTSSKPILQTEILVEQLQKEKQEKININKKFADIYKQKIIIKSPIPIKTIRSISNTTQ